MITRDSRTPDDVLPGSIEEMHWQLYFAVEDCKAVLFRYPIMRVIWFVIEHRVMVAAVFVLFILVAILSEVGR